MIVRYKPDHSLVEDRAYNKAEIDAAKVVWARDMGPVQNQELIAYFKDRRVWLLEPTETPPRLSVYPVLPSISGEGEAKRSQH